MFFHVLISRGFNQQTWLSFNVHKLFISINPPCLWLSWSNRIYDYVERLCFTYDFKPIYDSSMYFFINPPCFHLIIHHLSVNAIFHTFFQELPRWQSFDRHGGEARPAAAGAPGAGGQPISVVKKPERWWYPLLIGIFHGDFVVILMGNSPTKMGILMGHSFW